MEYCSKEKVYAARLNLSSPDVWYYFWNEDGHEWRNDSLYFNDEQIDQYYKSTRVPKMKKTKTQTNVIQIIQKSEFNLVKKQCGEWIKLENDKPQLSDSQDFIVYVCFKCVSKQQNRDNYLSTIKIKLSIQESNNKTNNLQSQQHESQKSLTTLEQADIQQQLLITSSSHSSQQDNDDSVSSLTNYKVECSHQKEYVQQNLLDMQQYQEVSLQQQLEKLIKQNNLMKSEKEKFFIEMNQYVLIQNQHKDQKLQQINSYSEFVEILRNMIESKDLQNQKLQSQLDEMKAQQTKFFGGIQQQLVRIQTNSAEQQQQIQNFENFIQIEQQFKLLIEEKYQHQIIKQELFDQINYIKDINEFDSDFTPTSFEDQQFNSIYQSFISIKKELSRLSKQNLQGSIILSQPSQNQKNGKNTQEQEQQQQQQSIQQSIQSQNSQKQEQQYSQQFQQSWQSSQSQLEKKQIEQMQSSVMKSITNQVINPYQLKFRERIQFINESQLEGKNEKSTVIDGGFGKVYLNIIFQGQKCVVKYFDIDDYQITNKSKNQGNYFLQELFNMSVLLLEHSNIVQLLAAGLDTRDTERKQERPKSRAFLVFKQIEGCTLEVAVLDEKVSFYPLLQSNYDKQVWVDKLKFCLEITKGVEFLSSFNLCHLDLKPNNVMIEKDKVENIYHPVIIDMGISRMTDKTVNTQQGLSQNWLPFEYVYENQSSPKTDVWSVGCLIFFIMTSDKPWSKDQIPAYTHLSKYHEFFSFVDQKSVEIIKPIRKILDGCFKHDKNERFSIKQLRMELEQNIDTYLQ